MYSDRFAKNTKIIYNAPIKKGQVMTQHEQEIADQLADDFEERTGQYPDMGEWYDEIVPEAERLAAYY